MLKQFQSKKNCYLNNIKDKKEKHLKIKMKLQEDRKNILSRITKDKEQDKSMGDERTHTNANINFTEEELYIK